jgi:hypothetical protein
MTLQQTSFAQMMTPRHANCCITYKRLTSEKAFRSRFKPGQQG